MKNELLRRIISTIKYRFEKSIVTGTLALSDFSFGNNTLIAALGVLFFSCSTKAQTNTPSYEERIDSIARMAQDYAGFNGTVLVGNDTGIVYQKSFGFGGKDKNVVLTPEYRFSPGSIDKEFTTVAIMLLKQQGHISYDDTLSKYLPDLPNWTKQVQIKHILTHTSGLPDIRYDRNLTTEDAIQQLMSIEDLDYEPGKDFGYGNLHSVLRTMVIEKVSGQSQDIFIKENIFIPAGMEQAFSRTTLDMNQPLVAYGSLPMSVAGIDMYLTAQDLYRWEQALWNGKIVDLKLLKEALAPHVLSGEPNRAIFDFGYYTTDNNGELLELSHDGTHPSHYTLQSFNFVTKTTIILLSSDGNKATLSLIFKAIKKLAENPVIEIPDSWWLNKEAKLYGYPATIKTYKSMINNGDKVKPKESLLNGMGYSLRDKTTIKDALLLLKLNLELYPNSANTHDSYADILIKAGKYHEAKSIAESGLKLAKQSGNNFLIRSLSSYLEKIDAAFHKSGKSKAASYTIAYATNASSESSKREIYLTNIEDTSKVKITNPPKSGGGYLAWSHDGKRIAFYAKYDNKKTWSIHTVNTDGTNWKRLTHADGKWDSSPTWSPDGKKIVFARYYKDSTGLVNDEIWSMNSDGSEQTQIKPLSGGGPCFTPDGRIVFYVESKDEKSEISIANMDGSNLVQLTNNDAEDWHPEVSPDGKEIAFVSKRDGNQEIYSMHINGSNQKRLTTSEVDDSHPSWSPDGSQLIFQSKTAGYWSTYMMNKDGSSVRKVIDNGSSAVWLKQ